MNNNNKKFQAHPSRQRTLVCEHRHHSCLHLGRLLALALGLPDLRHHLPGQRSDGKMDSGNPSMASEQRENTGSRRGKYYQPKFS